MMKDYNTLLEAMEDFRIQGYTEDFNISQRKLECKKLDIRLSPNEFSIDKVFRYEGMSDPDDESALYAISSHNGKIKGILLTAYGIYAEDASTEMFQKLKFIADQP